MSPTNAQWQKSSYSYQNGACVEVARDLSGAVGIRDSKRPDGPMLVVPRDAFRTLIRR